MKVAVITKNKSFEIEASSTDELVMKLEELEDPYAYDAIDWINSADESVDWSQEYAEIEVL